MEKLLIEFVNTFDLSLKKVQKEAGNDSSFSNLTVSQLQYIEAVHVLSWPTITEIADKLNITKASVTAGINKLCGLGYMIKTQSSEDRRVYRVSLTEAGERLVKVKAQALKEYGEMISSALSKDEARQFEVTLKKIVQHFKQD
jgi:DNA-binding MarR family transcriptional regulator